MMPRSAASPSGIIAYPRCATDQRRSCSSRNTDQNVPGPLTAESRSTTTWLASSGVTEPGRLRAACRQAVASRSVTPSLVRTSSTTASFTSAHPRNGLRNGPERRTSVPRFRVSAFFPRGDRDVLHRLLRRLGARRLLVRGTLSRRRAAHGRRCAPACLRGAGTRQPDRARDDGDSTLAGARSARRIALPRSLPAARLRLPGLRLAGADDARAPDRLPLARRPEPSNPRTRDGSNPSEGGASSEAVVWSEAPQLRPALSGRRGQTPS